MSSKIKILLFVSSCILFLGCDRTTKEMAKANLKNEPAVSYLNESIILTYAENTGAALSLGARLPKAMNFILLSLLPLIVMLSLFIYVLRKIKVFNKWKIFSFSMLIAGGLGNIFDRIWYDRHVTDFMLLQLGRFHTGIFNVADVCVTAGVIGTLIFHSDRKMKEIEVG